MSWMGHAPVMMLTIPVLATLAGGLFAIQAAKYRAALVAVGAGLLLGAAFLDLLPEAVGLGEAGGLKPEIVLGLALLFFLVFSVIETWLDGWRERTGSGKQTIGRVGGGLLIFHSFRDGMAIGAAFAASHTAGYAVATGIAAHDFGDGMNTVLLTTAGEKPKAADYWFLGADAVAPFLGGLTTVWWLLSSHGAAVLLALAGGFFLQMATSDFLPVVRANVARRGWLMAGVVGGAGFIWMANVLLG